MTAVRVTADRVPLSGVLTRESPIKVAKGLRQNNVNKTFSMAESSA
jgi:hypothetical protein